MLIIFPLPVGDGVPGGRCGRLGPHRGVCGRPRGDHRARRVRAQASDLTPCGERDGAERCASALWIAGQ